MSNEITAVKYTKKMAMHTLVRIFTRSGLIPNLFARFYMSFKGELLRRVTW